ncbi:MAG: hypothetical protein Q9160_008895 [Pyrenula sp. 1 TL-2023]
MPMKRARGTSHRGFGRWLDAQIANPDEQLYAEEYKAKRSDADAKIAYPDEQLYAEEYKRAAAEA